MLPWRINRAVWFERGWVSSTKWATATWRWMQNGSAPTPFDDKHSFDRLIDRYVCYVVELEGCVTVAAVTVGVTDRMNDTDSEIGSCVFIIFTLLLIRVRITITIIHSASSSFSSGASRQRGTLPNR